MAACLAPAESGPLPAGKTSPAPVAIPHFPDALHAFVWRNWESVSLDKMAEVLGTSAENVRELGASMGLPPHDTITLLRQAKRVVKVGITAAD
jgi:hypothetical protein